MKSILTVFVVYAVLVAFLGVSSAFADDSNCQKLKEAQLLLSAAKANRIDAIHQYATVLRKTANAFDAWANAAKRENQKNVEQAIKNLLFLQEETKEVQSAVGIFDQQVENTTKVLEGLNPQGLHCD